jgi:sugar lactone lactonase YvrE
MERVSPKLCIAFALMLTGGLRAQNIFTVAGIPKSHRDDVDGQMALNAPLGNVYGLLIDRATGRLIFNDEALVLRMEADGSLLTVAGLGANGRTLAQLLAGGNLASNLNFGVIRGMAQDSQGSLYISDAAGGRVYRIAGDGTVSTFAGGGANLPGQSSDGGPATASVVSSPRGLVFDSKGNLDIAEVYCNCIRQVTPAGTITTLYTLPASTTQGRFRNIEGLAIDSHDNLYFTEWFGNLVVKVSADGSVSTVLAGTGTAGFSGDGGPANAVQLNGPSGMALDATGNIYVADTMNHRIRLIAANGTISTVAGTGTCAFSGDGGAAVAAQLCLPAEVMFDAKGNLLIADYSNHRVRSITAGGVISTIAGSGVPDPAQLPPGSGGDGGPETHATFNSIGGIAFDSAGNLYVSESQVIRKLAANGTVSTIAGTGRGGYSGDGGPALQANLFSPGPISVGPDGAIYVITGDSRVRKITPDGNINLVAGTGSGTGINRAQGDGGPAVNATLNEPGEVAFDQPGNIYIADSSNARVRKIDKNGIISTVAGPGQPGVDYYNAVAVDPHGNLYVAWTHAPGGFVSATVNRVNADGSLTAVAGTGQPCTGGPGQFTGDGVPALQARLCAVIGLTVDPSGLLNLSEGGYSLLLRLAADGTIQRVAGNTNAIYTGDAGLAVQASLMGGQGFNPQTSAFDPAGNLYLSEPGLNIIRVVTPKSYQVTAAPSGITVTGPTPASQTILLSANFAETFPYSVHVTTTDTGKWLSTNRVTGLVGESIVVSFNPAGLAAGTYHGTIAIQVTAPVNGAVQEIDVPVSLTVPAVAP